MKLLYFPLLLYFLFCSNRCDPSLRCRQLVCLVVSLTLIPVLFYTIGGALGKPSALVNVAIFFIAPAVGFWLMNALPACRLSSKAATAAILSIGALFVLFTFFPPRLPLFLDPVTGTYGLFRP